MLRRPFILLAFLSGFGFAGVAMAAPAPVLSVTLDQARIANLPGHKTAKAISASNADAESNQAC